MDQVQIETYNHEAAPALNRKHDRSRTQALIQVKVQYQYTPQAHAQTLSLVWALHQSLVLAQAEV